MSIDIFGYLYAATVAAGGVIGYVKAGSVPSLGAGLAFGTILGVGAHFNSQHPPKPILQLCTSVILGGIMGLRWYKSGKMMPAGLICVISCCAAMRNIITYNRYLPLLGKES